MCTKIYPDNCTGKQKGMAKDREIGRERERWHRKAVIESMTSVNKGKQRIWKPHIKPINLCFDAHPGVKADRGQSIVVHTVQWAHVLRHNRCQCQS